MLKNIHTFLGWVWGVGEGSEGAGKKNNIDKIKIKTRKLFGPKII